MEKMIHSDPDDRIGLLGICLGLMENGTGLTDEEIHNRILELQELEDWETDD